MELFEKKNHWKAHQQWRIYKKMYVLYSDINQLRAKDESDYYKYNSNFQYRYSYIITNKVIIRGSISLSWREAYLVKISTSSKKVS